MIKLQNSICWLEYEQFLGVYVSVTPLMHRKMVNPNLNPIRICRGNIVRVKLEEVCERGSSNLKQSDVVKMSGKYPIYGASGHIGNADFYHQDKPYVSVIKDGAGIGRAYLNSAKSSVIGTMQYLLPKNNVIPKYLYYVIRYMHLEKYYTGATIPHIYYKDYKNEQFNLASLEKQERVVEVLEKCEKIINNRRSEIGKLDELIKARFVEMFGSINNNIYKYEIKTLQDVCEKIKDGTHQTPIYTEDIENGFKFLSSKDVTTGKIDWSNIKYITAELHEKLYEKIKPRKGDILLAKNGTTGVAAVVEKEEVIDIYVSLALLRPIDINSVYLWAAINSDETKNQFNRSLKGIGVPNLHLGEIKNTKIIVPPIALQNQFADFVHQIDKSKVVALNHLKNIAILLTICSIINENTNGKMGRRLYDN